MAAVRTDQGMTSLRQAGLAAAQRPKAGWRDRGPAKNAGEHQVTDLGPEVRPVVPEIAPF